MLVGPCMMRPVQPTRIWSIIIKLASISFSKSLGSSQELDGRLIHSGIRILTRASLPIWALMLYSLVEWTNRTTWNAKMNSLYSTFGCQMVIVQRRSWRIRCGRVTPGFHFGTLTSDKILDHLSIIASPNPSTLMSLLKNSTTVCRIWYQSTVVTRSSCNLVMTSPTSIRMETSLISIGWLTLSTRNTLTSTKYGIRLRVNTSMHLQRKTSHGQQNTTTSCHTQTLMVIDGRSIPSGPVTSLPKQHSKAIFVKLQALRMQLMLF